MSTIIWILKKEVVDIIQCNKLKEATVLSSCMCSSVLACKHNRDKAVNRRSDVDNVCDLENMK